MQNELSLGHTFVPGKLICPWDIHSSLGQTFVPGTDIHPCDIRPWDIRRLVISFIGTLVPGTFISGAFVLLGHLFYWDTLPRDTRILSPRPRDIVLLHMETTPPLMAALPCLLLLLAASEIFGLPRPFTVLLQLHPPPTGVMHNHGVQ